MVESTPKSLDAIFAALSEPTRRAVLERLTVASATVSELAAPFAMSLQAFLKHIRALEDAGLVRRTRIGRTNHITLTPDVLQPAMAWLAARSITPVAPAVLHVADGRRFALLQQAREMHNGLGPRMQIVRRALGDSPVSEEHFSPSDAAVRALRAAGDRRAMLAEILTLYEALGAGLDAVKAGGELDALRELILPLGRLMHELRPLLAMDRGAA